MHEALELIYEGRGFSGTIDLSPWLDQADESDVVALMNMANGADFDAAPAGLQRAYGDLAGDDRDTEPSIVLFRDQQALLRRLRTDMPALWEAASGGTIRCSDTMDMFGDAL